MALKELQHWLETEHALTISIAPLDKFLRLKRIPASDYHPGKLDASAHAQILLATLAQPTRSVARLAEVEGKAVPLETSQRLSRDMAFGAESHAANRPEQRALATLGLWVPSDFATT